MFSYQLMLFAMCWFSFMRFSTIASMDLCEIPPNEFAKKILLFGALDDAGIRLTLITTDLFVLDFSRSALRDDKSLAKTNQSSLVTDRWPALIASFPWFKRYLEIGINNSVPIYWSPNHLHDNDVDDDRNRKMFFKNRNDSNQSQLLMIFEIEPIGGLLDSSIGTVETVIMLGGETSGIVKRERWSYDRAEGLEGIEASASAIWIASDGEYFYTLLPDRYGGKQLIRIWVDVEKRRFKRASSVMRLCGYQQYGVLVTDERHRCDTPWNEPIFAGLHLPAVVDNEADDNDDQGYFYLFGSHQVFTFSDRALRQNDKPFPVTRISYDQFLAWCPIEKSVTNDFNVAAGQNRSHSITIAVDDANSTIASVTMLFAHTKLFYAMAIFIGLFLFIMMVAMIQCLLLSDIESDINDNDNNSQISTTVMTMVERRPLPPQPLSKTIIVDNHNLNNNNNNNGQPMIGGSIVVGRRVPSRASSSAMISHILRHRSSSSEVAAVSSSPPRTGDFGKRVSSPRISLLMKSQHRQYPSCINNEASRDSSKRGRRKNVKDDLKSDDSSFQFLVTKL